jgi:hypothetical protein
MNEFSIKSAMLIGIGFTVGGMGYFMKVALKLSMFVDWWLGYSSYDSLASFSFFFRRISGFYKLGGFYFGCFSY